jgi:hypothetical protein
MSTNNEREQVGKLLLLGFFVVALMVFLSLSFRADNVIAAAFRLDDVQICEELDDDMKPVKTVNILPGGAKQACLWFEYSRAREGDSLEVIWSYENRRIQRDAYRLSDPKGARAFYLMKDDGSILPGGDYSVAISCNGRERGTARFSVEAASGDYELDEEEALD